MGASISVEDPDDDLKCAKPKMEFRASSADCVLCLEPRAAAFAAVPCGHQALCEACVPLLQEKECPVCRSHVDTFVKIFTAQPARDEDLRVAVAQSLAAEAVCAQSASDALCEELRSQVAKAEGDRAAAERRANAACAVAAKAAAAVTEAKALAKIFEQQAADAHASLGKMAVAAEVARQAADASVSAATAVEISLEADLTPKAREHRAANARAAATKAAAGIAMVEDEAKGLMEKGTKMLKVGYEMVS